MGYLSSFFHRDNWMKPVWGLLGEHDREEFEVHLINDSPGGAFALGYTPHPADQVHAVGTLANGRAAELVRRAQLDLLVELNGYSLTARLPLLGAGLAPVVVGWFNHYATTGLKEVDALIGDAAVVEPEEERYYSERILRVEGSYLSYRVNYPTPDVSPPPCAAAGALTFGSLASLYKLTDQVLDTWAAFLRDAPAVRFFLKNGALTPAANRELLWQRFEERGIPRERVELEGRAEHFAFLETYDRLDVALDPFPYSGGTTTSESIWQGVPVMSLRGDRWASRTSVSILRAAGLDEWCVDSREAYLAACLRVARDARTPARLADLRSGMRARLEASPLFDMASFARGIEALYRDVCGR